MSTIELAQVCFITPILNGLEQAGANLTKLEYQSGLNTFDLAKSENYIPVTSMYSFFDCLSREESIADPQIIFAKDIQLTSLAEWGGLIAYAPDVLSSMNLAIKYQQVVLTNEVLSLHIEGTKATFSQRFTDCAAKGRAQMDAVNVMFVLNGMRIALGHAWDPLEIHFQSEREPCLDGLLQAGSATRVRCGQKSSAVVFSTKVLGASMLGFEIDEREGRALYALESFQSKVEAIIDSMTHKPNLSVFLQFSGINIRTLQRRLSDEGCSFSSVFERWRFKKAIRLLADQQLMIKEISDQLHYTDTSNFERAFRRWTNMTPGKYRELDLS